MKNSSYLKIIFIRNSQEIMKEIWIKVLTTYLLQERTKKTRVPNDYNLSMIRLENFHLTNIFEVPTLKNSRGTKIRQFTKYIKQKCILNTFLSHI